MGSIFIILYMKIATLYRKTLDQILLWTVQQETHLCWIVLSLQGEVEAAIKSLEKGNQLELTTYEWNWCRLGENLWSMPWQPSAIWYGRQENGQHHGLSPWLSHSLRKATCNDARTIEQAASSAVQAKLCWRYYSTDFSQGWKQSWTRNKHGSEREGAPLNKSLTCIRTMYRTNKTCTMSL